MGAFAISKKYGLTAQERGLLNDRISLIQEGMAKEAMGDAGKAFMYTLSGGLAGSAVAYGVPAAIESVRNARVRANREKHLKEMVSAHPQIRNYSKREIELVYNSLAMHAPRVLTDPLLGGQVMLEALRRGTHMDVGQLSNVSRMTGGAGLKEHEQEAVRVMAQAPQAGATEYHRMRTQLRRDEASEQAEKRKSAASIEAANVKHQRDTEAANLRFRMDAAKTRAGYQHAESLHNARITGRTIHHRAR